MSDSPAISITISTVQGWPDIRPAVVSAEAASTEAGGELVVTDGSGGPVPEPGELGPTTRWEAVPGASIFQLRSLGYRLSRAPIVAITEDHCRVPADWASKMLAAHAANPEASVIGGSVENGATGSAIDWASFLLVQAAIASPIASGPAKKLAGAVNVAYKREALERMDDFDGLGAFDVLHQRALKRSGELLIADDRIRVVHDQSLGMRGTTAIHFHAGRTFAGFLRQRMDALAWARCLGMPVVPFVRFGRVVVLGRRKGYGPEIAQTWPAILFLCLVQGVGNAVGFAAGVGDSPGRVQ
jgi:hypothetical protein